MSNKLTYTEAVRLLAAFLGTNIMVEKPCSFKYFKCQVYRMEHLEGFDYNYRLIAESDSWEQLLDLLLHRAGLGEETFKYHMEINSASRLYQFRRIGRTL